MKQVTAVDMKLQKEWKELKSLFCFSCVQNVGFMWNEN
jgi:hypothetical protein